MQPEHTVHVVDDDEAARESLALLLRSFGYTVQTYASGVEFMDRLKQAAAGCVLLDIHMPEMDGLEVQRRLNAVRARLAVIVLTGRADVPLAVAAMKGGAVEFLEKPYRNDDLLSALDEGFRRLEIGAGNPRADGEEARRSVERLTPRERDVLRGLMAGLPNKLIARDLGLSHRTVEVHRAKLMDKLGARGLSTAVRIALAAGLEPAL